MAGIPDLLNPCLDLVLFGLKLPVLSLADKAELAPIANEPFVGVDAATEKAIVAILQDLRKNGKTVVVVHHDIQTLKEYFDWVMLLNVRRIALGPTKKVLTNENLKRTYGGRAAFLSKTMREK